MSELQYQALAEPMVPRAASDAVATDSWQPSFPSAIKRFAVTAACASIVAAPLFVPDVTTPAPAHSWRSNSAYPDRIHRTTLHRAAHQVFAQNVEPLTILIDVGGSISPSGSIDLWQYQAITGPLDVPVEFNIDIRAWRPEYPDRITRGRTHARHAQTWIFDTQWDAPAAVTVPASSWQNVQPTGMPRPVIQTYRAPSFFTDASGFTSAPDVPPTMGWRSITPQIPTPKRYPRACYTWAQPHYAVVIQVPVMSWTGMYLDPPVLPKRSVALRTHAIAPIYLADITVQAPAQSWQGHYPPAVRGPRRAIAALQPESQSALVIADLTVTAPTLSARATYPDRIHAKPFVRGPQAYQADKFTAPTVVAAPDGPKPSYPDRVYGKRVPAEAPKFTAIDYILDVTLPAPSHSWAPTYPDSASIKLRAPYLDNGFENDSWRIGEAPILPIPDPPATVTAVTEIVGSSQLESLIVGSQETETVIVGTTAGTGGVEAPPTEIIGRVG